jgi:hypothetical protein
MDTNHTVLLTGALAKLMELSTRQCSKVAEQTVITLNALVRSKPVPESLRTQIEDMLEALQEQYQLEQSGNCLFKEMKEKVLHEPTHARENVVCIHSISTRYIPIYADTSLE